MIEADVQGVTLRLQSAPTLFSPHALDAGTRAMLSLAGWKPGMRVLDLGCGTGAVGIVAATHCGAEGVYLLDRDPIAVQIAQANARAAGLSLTAAVSDGFRQVDWKDFDAILSNPPYQSDFSVARHFIEKGFNRLRLGGRMYMVTKRRLWYQKKFIAIFGGVRVAEIDGYYVFVAEKRSMNYASSTPVRERNEQQHAGDTQSAHRDGRKRIDGHRKPRHAL